MLQHVRKYLTTTKVSASAPPVKEEKRIPGSFSLSLFFFFKLIALGQSNQDGGQKFSIYSIISKGNPFQEKA
jgi:hypothetical protein